MSVMKWPNQKLKHIKRMNNNCRIPDLEQTYFYVYPSSISLLTKTGKSEGQLLVNLFPISKN